MASAASEQTNRCPSFGPEYFLFSIPVVMFSDTYLVSGTGFQVAAAQSIQVEAQRRIGEQ